MLKPFFVTSFVFAVLTGGSTFAEPLILTAPQVPAPFYPGYSENINFSPSFHVLQNDPELSEYSVSPGQSVTDLCIPASGADLLLYQISQKPNPLKLPVPGVIDETHADGANTVKSLIQQCELKPRTIANPHDGINWVDMVSCLENFYASSGYPQAQIHYVRKNASCLPNINCENRTPTLNDIRDTLKNGGDVIAIISQKSGTHSVNIFGYSFHPEQPDAMAIYLQNPNRLYRMDFATPVFDTALLTTNEKDSTVELTTLEGRLLNFPGFRTYLVGLVLVQVQSVSTHQKSDSQAFL